MDSSYIKGIDGMRGLAVLAVLLYHLDSYYLPGGFSGVDVFFVISGFVVTASLSKRKDASFKEFTIAFYKRRVVRILPALLFSITSVSILTALFIPVSWLSQSTLSTALLACWGLGNIAQLHVRDGYFGPQAEFNPFTHTWSLGVEEQFYLLFPFLIYMGFSKGASRVWATPLLCAVTTASFLYGAFQTQTDINSAFYGLPSRFWELSVGALLFQACSRRSDLFAHVRSFSTLCLWGGIVLLSASFLLLDKNNFPFPLALIPVTATCLLIAGLVRPDSTDLKLRRLLEFKWLMFVGKISYSLYLWHWPIIVLTKWTVGIDVFAAQIAAVALSLAMALFSYYYVERGCQDLITSLKLSDRRVIQVGGGAVFVAFCFSCLTFFSARYTSLSVVTRNPELWYPSPLKAEALSSKKLEGNQLFVLGDSHAQAYQPILNKLASDHSLTVIDCSVRGRSIANLMAPSMYSNGVLKEEIDNTIQTICAQSKVGDIVFLASLRLPRFSRPHAKVPNDQIWELQYGEHSLRNRELAYLEAELLIERLVAGGLRVMIDTPKPILKSPPYRASDWFNSMNSIGDAGFNIARSELLEHRAPPMRLIAKLQDRFPEMMIWDPFPILCPDEICSAFKDGKPLFFDGDHLSGYGNQVLYDSFKTFMLRAWEVNED